MRQFDKTQLSKQKYTEQLKIRKTICSICSRADSIDKQTDTDRRVDRYIPHPYRGGVIGVISSKLTVCYCQIKTPDVELLFMFNRYSDLLITAFNCCHCLYSSTVVSRYMVGTMWTYTYLVETAAAVANRCLVHVQEPIRSSVGPRLLLPSVSDIG